MINTVLIDLDGTLISFDQSEFLRLYFEGVVKKFIPHGYPKDVVLNALYEGVKAMLKNDGKVTNEEAFWNRFSYFLPNNIYFFENTFLDFYNNEFNEISKIVMKNEYSHKAIEELKRKNIDIILATNPLYPKIATENRIKWGGYNRDDFKLVTTFENSSFAKPNPLYYKEILEKINKSPSECIMIGNDVGDDMVAEVIGIDTYLVTDNIINPKNVDISKYKNGNYQDFYEFVKKLK